MKCFEDTYLKCVPEQPTAKNKRGLGKVARPTPGVVWQGLLSDGLNPLPRPECEIGSRTFAHLAWINTLPETCRDDTLTPIRRSNVLEAGHLPMRQHHRN